MMDLALALLHFIKAQTRRAPFQRKQYTIVGNSQESVSKQPTAEDVSRKQSERSK